MDTQSIPPSFRAWQYRSTAGGIEKNLHLKSGLPIPIPRPEQHLVRIVAVSLNPIDYKAAETPLVGRLLVPSPATPGIDIVGRLVVAAAGSSGLQPGQLVYGAAGTSPFAAGGLAEFVAAPAQSLIAVPDGIEACNAAALPVAALTAYQTIVPHVNAGDRVFINAGSGGTGIFGIQIAKAVGCHVTTTCSAANVELCRRLGADKVVDYRSRDVVEALKEQPLFNHVVDNAGFDPNLYYRCHEYTEVNARYIMVPGPLSLKGLRDAILMRVWPGFLGGGKRKFSGFLTQANREQLETVANWVKEGKVKVVVDSRFPFEQAPQAFERLRTHRAKGKIIVDVNPDA